MVIQTHRMPNLCERQRTNKFDAFPCGSSTAYNNREQINLRVETAIYPKLCDGFEIKEGEYYYGKDYQNF